jgi:hypothetical protein
LFLNDFFLEFISCRADELLNFFSSKNISQKYQNFCITMKTQSTMPSQDTAAGLVATPEIPTNQKGHSLFLRYDGGDDRSSDRPKSKALVIVITRHGSKVNRGLINCTIA